jgi:hypothetical protein
MPFWPHDLDGWVDVVTKSLTSLFAIVAGGWALRQYVRSTRLRAAEILLKVEEEFRIVLPTFGAIEHRPTYESVIKPVLKVENEKRKGTVGAELKIDAEAVKKLAELDRCFRFLYLCSVLNDALHVDRALRLKAGALHRAYYHYFSMLLPDERRDRPDLLAYTDYYYPLLTKWIREHQGGLSDFRSDRLMARETRGDAQAPIDTR